VIPSFHERIDREFVIHGHRGADNGFFVGSIAEVLPAGTFLRLVHLGGIERKKDRGMSLPTKLSSIITIALADLGAVEVYRSKG
jgi:hypothetical protein